MLPKGDDITPDYKAMYCKLFHAQVKVVDALQYAQAVIEQVRQETEGLAMESPDPVCLADQIVPFGEGHAETEQDAPPPPHPVPERM